MKKILSILLLAILSVFVFIGCKQDNSASVIAKNLDNNLNKLNIAVNKLDTIDNKYLSNPDIYSSLSTPTGSRNNKYFALAFNDFETTQISNENVKQILIDKITDKLLSQNSETNSCYTCEKYCDNNGNCYYTDCNGNNYCYDSNGNCYDCTSIPENCEYVGQRNISCENCEDSSSLQVEQLNTTLNENSDNIVTSNNTIENQETVDDNINNTNNNLNTPNPTVRMFYFTQDSFSPIKLKYNPRYINQYNEETINEQIESYLFKVQKLYAMSEDSIEANTILQNCKQNIIDCINEIRDLNVCIINGQCEPSIQELQALNNYITDIKTTTKRLKDCNGELSKEINNISETNANVMINSVDVMNSNYLRLLNHIDTRITYHKSAIATLEQIKHLLDNATNNNSITDEEFEEIIENFTIEENTEEETTQDNELSNENTNKEAEDDFNNNEINDNNESENTSITDDYLVNNSDIENNTSDTNTFEENTSQEVSSEEIINEEPLDEEIVNDNNLNSEENSIEDDLTHEELNENTEENSTTLTTHEENNTGTIDTYSLTNSWSNIDTYKNNNEETNQNENNENLSEDIVINNQDINNDSLNNNENIIEDNPDNFDNTLIQDNNTENVVSNNDSDNILTNEDNNTNINNNANNNETINNGVYQNSVITQNNLNNDDGYGGYYYTNDGEIKNNGVNNNNEIGNNGNTIENNLNRNNNVNTYGYNTLLDMINQGTVNNGINTL